MRTRTIEYEGEEWEVEAVQPLPPKTAGRTALVGETEYHFRYRKLEGNDQCTVVVRPEVGRRFDADDMSRVALGLPRTEPELSDQELAEILKAKRA